MNLYDEDGEVVGYKKNIYCFPPMGTPDGGGFPDYMKETGMRLNFFSCRIGKSLSVSIKTGRMTVLPPDLTIILKKTYL